MASINPDRHWPPFLPDLEVLLAPGETRREAGSLHFSEALQSLLRSVSHPQLSDLADWACNESGNLHISQISHMRNNKVRMLGTKAIDALGRVNQLAWVAHHRGELLARLGTAPLTPRIQMLLRAYQPLLHPLTREPLGAGDFMALYLGYLRLPIELPRSLSLTEAEDISGVLGDWLEAQLTEQGLSFREASKRLQEAWSGEAAGAKRLVRVLAGLEDYGPRQLAEDWEAISLALLTALEQEGEPWGLADQLLELAGAPTQATTEGTARQTRQTRQDDQAKGPAPVEVSAETTGKRSGKGSLKASTQAPVQATGNTTSKINRPSAKGSAKALATAKPRGSSEASSSSPSNRQPS